MRKVMYMGSKRSLTIGNVTLRSGEVVEIPPEWSDEDVEALQLKHDCALVSDAPVVEPGDPAHAPGASGPVDQQPEPDDAGDVTAYQTPPIEPDPIHNAPAVHDEYQRPLQHRRGRRGR